MRNLLLLLGILWCLVHHCFGQYNSTEWPIHDDGYTDRLQWDHYSMIIDGERTFIWSGEFHPWRIPVPEVWQDLLQKIKAGGFNTVSIYLHWAFHAPNDHTLDFETGARNVDLLFQMAKDAGLFVTFRNGPYVNAETTAGGFALWVTTGAYGSLRNNDKRYQAAWEPFMAKSNEISGKHQYAVGGPVILQQIENEIGGQWKSDGTINHEVADYMAALQDNARENKVTSPLLTNAPNMRSLSWSQDYLPGLGDADIYGVDSYPACWSCDLSECGNVPEFTIVSYVDHFNLVSPTMPSFIPEFQGGSYNPWGGPGGGCGGPGTLLDTEFVNVFYRDLAAQRITMISLYMLYGGTNWGGLAANVVSTSYDYSAPIRESRQIEDKYSETKLVGLFFRAAKDLTMTDRPHDIDGSITSSPNVGATELRNPETGAGFYVVRHMVSANQDTTDFTMNIVTKSNNFTVPQFVDSIRLAGRQSKIIVTDFTFGDNTLLYSTADILSHSIVDGKSILAVWLPDGESGELAILGGSSKKKVLSENSNVSFHQVRKDLVVTWTTNQDTQDVVQFDNFHLILLSRTKAYRFWAPMTNDSPISPPTDIVFVTGPYLVRTLIYEGNAAIITGDIDDTTTLEVWAPFHIHSITWNGKPVSTQRMPHRSIKANLAKPSLTIEKLQSSIHFTGWKYSDALPESSALYDDSNWVIADKTYTPNPQGMKTPVSLYSDDYGFHTGVQIFRGKFSENSDATGVNLNLQGGTAFGWSAWLNDRYLGSYPGTSTASSASQHLTFSNVPQLNQFIENVLTIVMDHSGHDQRSGALFPRGILEYELTSPTSSNITTFREWRIAGNAGGESNIDPLRGAIHEGGLHPERLGWHLPGFDDSDWEERNLSDGVPGGRIGFFRTTCDLDIPLGYDVSMEFILSSKGVGPLRAQLYVNGYQYGKFVPQVGNQIAFPVPPGILNYRGSNTIGLNLWSQSNDTAVVEVEWHVLGVYESSFGDFDGTHLQPEWTKDRLQWA